MPSRPLIIGTAGHIDHGKTSLVRALTGVNLDRLPEERERGITIALGFTQLELDDAKNVAFVDVPGHEKLVRTMISGATGLDAVILVVAATEGVMPQTREHLDILELLGVEHGLVALTKCDLVDEETIELAEMDVMDTVAGTFLDSAPIVRLQLGESVSGTDEVREAITQIADHPNRIRDDKSCFRLPIDRAFIQRGFGTVVTGTASGMSIADGSPVWIQPLGIHTRIRGLQVHGNAVDQADTGQRVAANLAGVERDDLERGMVVVDEPSLLPASILDVQIKMLPDVPRIPASSRVRLLIGTAEVLAVADPIGQDALIENSTRFVQLRTENPIVALPGDRFIIRRESPLETLGGGVVLDPWASRAKRKLHAEIADDLQALLDGDQSRLLKRAGPGGLTLDQARVRGGLTGTTLGDRVIHSDHVDSLTKRLLDGLASWHQDRPLDPGAPRRALHSGALAALNERAFDALIGHMAQQGTVCAEGPTIRLSTFTIQLNDVQKDAHDALISRLERVGLEGEPFAEIIKGPTGLLQLILDQGRAFRIADRVVLAEPLEQLKTDVLQYFSEKERLSPAEFKSMTQLSRRMAIPLMEWLDSEGITRRDGDARVAR